MSSGLLEVPSSAAMGLKRPPAPLLALSLLLGLLALKELAMPAPYRAAPQPAAKGGELEDDDADADPFDFSEDEEEGMHVLHVVLGSSNTSSLLHHEEVDSTTTSVEPHHRQQRTTAT